MMFNEHPFLDRFDAAAGAGFEAVAFLYPCTVPPEVLAERVRRNKLTVALFNMPPGDWAAGERGLAGLATPVSSAAIIARPAPLSMVWAGSGLSRRIVSTTARDAAN